MEASLSQPLHIDVTRSNELRPQHDGAVGGAGSQAHGAPAHPAHHYHSGSSNVASLPAIAEQLANAMRLFETRTLAVLAKAEQVLPLQQATAMADGSSSAPAAAGAVEDAMDSPRGGPDGRTPLLLATPEARLRRLVQMQCVTVARDAQVSMAALREALAAAIARGATEVPRAAAADNNNINTTGRGISSNVHQDSAFSHPPLGAPSFPESPASPHQHDASFNDTVDGGSPLAADGTAARLISALKQERRTARHSYAAAQRLGLEVVRLRERLQVAEVELAALRGRHQQDAAAAREREERLALALRTAALKHQQQQQAPAPPPPPPAPPVQQDDAQLRRPPAVSDSSDLSDSDDALPVPLAYHRRQKRQAGGKAAIGTGPGRVPAFRAGSYYNNAAGGQSSYPGHGGPYDGLL